LQLTYILGGYKMKKTILKTNNPTNKVSYKQLGEFLMEMGWQNA